MNKQTTRKGVACYAPTIAAGLALAMAFTLNACGGDGGGGGDDTTASSSSGNGSSSSSSSGGGSQSSSSQPSHEHAWGEWSVTTAPTCEAGVETRTCAGDNSHKETRSIAKLFDWGEWSVTTAATCEAAGVKTRACTGDNSHKDTEEIAKLSWEWTVTTPATPTTVGEETGTCHDNASHVKTRPLYPKCKGVEYNPADGKFLCDERDGKRYKYVDIDGQVWMAENLNHNAAGSKCGSTLSGSGTLSDADAVACGKYGRLYNWAAAMGGATSSDANPSGVQGVCPSGWHLPSDAEWDALMAFIHSDKGLGSFTSGTSYYAGKYLKAASGWNDNGNGEDAYGFSALPGGRGFFGGDFDDAGGVWWSASEDNSSYAYNRFIYNNEYAYWTDRDKSSLFSVRCLQD